MDRVFQALAHADRRRMLDILKAEPGASVGTVAGRFGMSRVAVMKHLKVLEDAGLLIRKADEKDGRSRRLFFNAAPIQMVYDRWTTEYSRYWAPKVTGIKYAVEDPAEDNGKGGRSDG